MLKNYLLFGLVALFAGLSLRAYAADDKFYSAEQKIVELKEEFNLPSLSVAIGLNNRLTFAQAVGYSDIEKDLEANTDTQYSVGSLSKPMTGLAVARLVATGKLDLRQPVSDYLERPQYTSKFSIAELAAHTAGVPHDTPERDLAEFIDVKDHQRPMDAFYVFDKHPLLFEPGTGQHYSSNGYILLSAVIEEASSKGYVDYLSSEVWDRLGMKATELDTSFAGQESEATYYSSVNKEGLHVRSLDKRDRSFLFGGGGFISTPTDLVRMAQATYGVGYLSVEALQALSMPVKLRSGEINEEKYSLGWRVASVKLGKDDKSWLALHHGGVTDNAATAYLLVVPECKASIAFATNYVPGQFWRMRGRIASILKEYIDIQSCDRWSFAQSSVDA
ncbi:serine hydrolase domain-containing protein [Microbulbifer sp. TRSA001]|uniref:serine hydrolase domain-containing protein n=1 Tax=unclassified Microbulbifer TaxID=2619833 RepID=UPI0024AE06E0|nr:serine hydrolase domain-containing protein [Microbulbifer sp. VAAF005]WHI49151.1 serine hydrolase [Microbulbifer sp. VAAF005]